MKFKINLFSIPLILASIVIFIASHQEGVPFDTSIFIFQDKVMHFFAYTIYGFTIQLYLKSLNLAKSKYIMFTIMIGSLFGLSDEFHQYFIPNRSTEFFDWVADTLGVSFSLVFSKYISIFYNYLCNKLNKNS
jgi:VanZ family protein